MEAKQCDRDRLISVIYTGGCLSSLVPAAAPERIY